MTPADITAKLDELEAAALAATPGGWVAVTSELTGIAPNEVSSICMAGTARPEDAAFIVANDPAQVLRTIAAQRAILALHYPIDPCDAHDANLETIPCETLEALASQWDDVPAGRGAGA